VEQPKIAVFYGILPKKVKKCLKTAKKPLKTAKNASNIAHLSTIVCKM